MIENSNVSKTAPSGEFVDIKKYIGVASIGVLALNPDNEKLRKFGWSIPEGAEEPKYVTVDSEGKKSARVRFLVQIQDLEEKPIIALDFWIRNDVQFNKDKTKCKIIDRFGRTAYGTKEEVQGKKIPQYANGPAQIDSNYKYCHVGEEELVSFLMKLLNITPLSVFNRIKQEYVPTTNPGSLTIDHWDWLMAGKMDELAEYVALQPDNRVKVVLGIRNTDDNRSYQTFLSGAFFSNGSFVDKMTGEYTAARKAIDRWLEYHTNGTTNFSATPVKEWTVSATVVEDTVEEDEDMPEFPSAEDDMNGLPF